MGLGCSSSLLDASIYLFYGAEQDSWSTCKADIRMGMGVSDLTIESRSGKRSTERPWNRKTQNQDRQEETDAV